MSGNGPAVAAVIVAGGVGVLAFLGGFLDRRWQRTAVREERDDRARRGLFEDLSGWAARIAFSCTGTHGSDEDLDRLKAAVDTDIVFASGRVHLYCTDEEIHAAMRVAVLASEVYNVVLEVLVDRREAGVHRGEVWDEPLPDKVIRRRELIGKQADKLINLLRAGVGSDTIDWHASPTRSR